ncbi:helix-turn-helix domain-containing protein [Kribbella sp. NBC_01505]|uniref:AlkA N-terminal domain-containing protein n=1 Tax=Kribbella sp. NBC_01505 TaxID=2903580 RepID=UPI003867428B
MTTYSAVRTTGIYCRPGCGAKPLAENVQTFELAAAAEAAGFRACLRCRPYRVAGTVADEAPELVCRAVQLIIAGVLDAAGEAALAARIGVSARHLRRMFHEHLGVTPDQFARSRRAHFARRLLDDSELGIAEVAFASGFGSLRQFNRAMREIFRASPKELRERRRKTDRLTADGGLVLRLPYTPPYDWEAMSGFLAAQAIPGVESVEGGVYRRTITLDGAPGLLEIGPGGPDHLLLHAHLPFWEGVMHVVDRAACLVGLETDLSTARQFLSGDPELAPRLAARPGLRIPGAWGPFEVAVQAVLRNPPETLQEPDEVRREPRHRTEVLAVLGAGDRELSPWRDEPGGLGSAGEQAGHARDVLGERESAGGALPGSGAAGAVVGEQADAHGVKRGRGEVDEVRRGRGAVGEADEVRRRGGDVDVVRGGRGAVGEGDQVRRGGGGADEVLRKIVEVYGIAVPGLGFGLTHLFPAPEALTGVEPVAALAREVADGNIVLDCGRPEELARRLEQVAGVSRRAAQLVVMRLGGRDAWPLDGDAGHLSPWRSLAAFHHLVDDYAKVS